MINGIPYPICIDLKRVIEQKRKEFAQSQGIKIRSVSQAKFTKLLIPIVQQGKINTNPIINKKYKKHEKRKFKYK